MEIWKAADQYFEASSLGRIKTVKRGTILAQILNSKNGYIPHQDG